jgi:hypothetical protein
MAAEGMIGKKKIEHHTSNELLANYPLRIHRNNPNRSESTSDRSREDKKICLTAAMGVANSFITTRFPQL